MNDATQMGDVKTLLAPCLNWEAVEVRVCVAYQVPLIAIWLKTQVRFKILCVAAFIRDRQLRAENTSLALHLSGPLL